MPEPQQESTDPTRNGHSAPPEGPPSDHPQQDDRDAEPITLTRQRAAHWAQQACGAQADQADAETGEGQIDSPEVNAPAIPSTSPSDQTSPNPAADNAADNPTSAREPTNANANPTNALTPSPAPFPPAPGGGTDVPRRWEWRFLASLAVEGVVNTACDLAGVDHSTPYRLRDRSPRFRALWEEALKRSTDVARQEVFERGVIGWKEPVFYAGEVVGHQLRKDTTCLLALLKSRDPAFRDKVDLTHAGPGGGAVQIKTEAEVKAIVQPYLPALEAVAASLLERAELERKAKLLEGPPPSE